MLSKPEILGLLTVLMCQLLKVSVGFSNSSNSSQVTEDMTQVITRFVSDTNHQLLRPNAGGGPTTVKVGMEIVYIGDFQEADMVFTLELYFRQYWQDNRLAFQKPDKPVTLPGNIADRLWQPDTFFENGKKGELHKLTTLNKAMRIHPDGKVLVSTRITLSCLCAMDFRKFPMDQQVCDLNFYSYGFTMSDIVYEWNGEKVIWSKEQEIAQFELSSVVVLKNCRMYITGNYSVLGVRFVFIRRIGHYLTRVYIPATLIVLLSWLSFFVDRTSVPARVSLGITTVLTMTTLLIGIGQGSLPVVSYVKAVDWYLIVCYILVFGAFAEYALINYLETNSQCCVRQEQRRNRKDSNQAVEINGYAFTSITSHRSDIDDEEGSTAIRYDCLDLFNVKSLLSKWRRKSLDCHSLDECAKIVFIFCFIVFNLFYWWYFLYFSA